MRLGEALNLYPRDLDPDAGTVNVRRGKGGKQRTIGLDPTAFAVIELHRAFKRAGLYRKGKLTHEIRRAVASTVPQNGTPIHVVKETLGHSAIKTTELYAFTNEEAKKEAAKNALI